MNTLDQTFNELQEVLSEARNSNILLKKEVELLNAKLKLLNYINIFLLAGSAIFLSLFALMYLKLQ
jgi:hypothetical protein